MKVRQFIKKLRIMGVEVIEDRGKGGHVLANIKVDKQRFLYTAMLIWAKYFSKKFANS